jgi:type IV pilus assembly protein PilN
VALSQRDQRRVSAFNLRFQLVRATDAQKSIAAANGTASSPGGK